jgi:gas vesicle protein
MAYGGKAGETRTSAPAGDDSAFPVGALVTGLAIGLVVGAGVALLFSPAAGADTRRRLRRRMRRIRRRGGDAWAELSDELRTARRKLVRARRRRRREQAASEPLEPA